MAHPYSDLPAEAFWKTGAAHAEPGKVVRLWRPRNRMTQQHRFATFGSCFSQHISTELQRIGLAWVNAERAPQFGKKAYLREFGYGVFSARTGNIYTAAQLCQWAEWAAGESIPPAEVWPDGDCFRDPFRPAIEPQGFASPEELFESRAVAIESFGEAIRQADWLIFTMGLTEGWQHAGQGHYYAMCPGTLGGSFAPETHVFVNLGLEETEAKMRRAISLMRRLNPELRVLLTVSPVPMIATASGRHVLEANGQTKSTLRTVAARLVEGDEGIDYFPAYDLVTAVPMVTRFLAPNMRAISPEGLAMVMAHFRGGFEEPEAELPPGPANGDEARFDTSRDELIDDLVCEELLLEAFSPQDGPARN